MQVKTSIDLGALVRDRRTHLELSQGDLAARVGVSRPWIAQLEKGKSRAQLGLVLRTLNALGVKLDASIHEDRRSGSQVIDLNQIINNTLTRK